jgi:hypothetical protein
VTSQPISVTVIGDAIPEGGFETYLVNLSNASNATLGDASATGTINDS